MWDLFFADEGNAYTVNTLGNFGYLIWKHPF